MKRRHGERGVLEALNIILRNMVGELRTDSSGNIKLHDIEGGRVTANIAELLLSHGANPDAINYMGGPHCFTAHQQSHGF